MTRQTTIVILVVVTVGLIVWDIYAGTNRERRDTISVVILGYAKRWTIIPFALGVVMGHLLWPQ